MTFLFRQAERIAFLGDQRLSHQRLSQGSERDVIALTMERIAQRDPTLELSYLNMCAAGLTLEQALEFPRLEADWVVIALGMFDAFQQTKLKAFERDYRALLRRFTPRAVICEPCALQPDQIAILEPYRAIIASIAFEIHAPLAQFQRALDRVLPTTGAEAWGTGLTLNSSGSAVLTEELLGAIGFEVFEDDDEFPANPDLKPA